MLPRLAPLAALGLALVASCADESDAPLSTTPPPRASLVAGEFTLHIDASSREVRFERNGQPLLRFQADAFQIGEVTAIDPTYSYDPYGLYAKVALFREPDGLAWRGVTAARLDEATSGGASLALSFEGGHEASLRFEVVGPGDVRAKLVPRDASRVAYLRIKPRASADEGFYGLGEYFDDVNHRGKLRAMQIVLDPSIDSGYNEVHVPVPLLIGTRGWGLFVDSRRPAVFDVATQDPEQIDANFGTGQGSAEGLTFHLLGAAHPLDITRLYYGLTGLPRLPARWALGPWVWRDENKDQAEVESDIDRIRDLDLATNGLWIDRPYASAVNSFDFNPAQFPDPVAMIGKLHASGLRTALWHTPYLDEKDPITQAAIAEAKAKGFYPPASGPGLNKWGNLIDLTNPEAFAWWQGKIKAYTALGVEGFKLDYAEDVVPGAGSVRTGWRFFDGSDDQTAHNTYQLFYHRVYAETLPADGGFLLCRHAVHGDQKNGPIIWPGDLDATFARHREKVTKPSGESYNSVGGLVASMIGGLTLGPSGFAFYGSDTGGYRNSPPDKELFIRWFEQTALSSVMQVGTSSNTVAWEKTGGPGFDDELLDLYRIYTRLHLRLWPYEWTLAQRLLADGRPIQRPFGLAYPELNEHPSDQYLFGDDLLVAPVVDRGATTKSVFFPPGRWVDWWTGEAIEGGSRRTVAAPLGTLPLYLREGGIVPMLRPTIDTLAPTTLPDKVDSYATTAGPLHARVVLGGGSSFLLFDGAEISASQAGQKVKLTLRPGTEFDQGFRVELLDFRRKPERVLVGGAQLPEAASVDALEKAGEGWRLDERGALHVWLKGGGEVEL